MTIRIKICGITHPDDASMAADAGAKYVDLLYVEPDYWEDFGPVHRPYRDRLVLATIGAAAPATTSTSVGRPFATSSPSWATTLSRWP